MIKHNHLYIIFIIAVLISCTNSKFTKEDFTNYSAFVSNTPLDKKNIYGCYSEIHFFGGTFIILNNDGTYFFNQWTDLIDEENPILGYEGVFATSKDSLVLKFEHYKIDYSKDSTKIDAAKKGEKKYKNLKPTDIWLFKQIGDHIFLVPETMNDLFGKFSLENRGVPMIVKKDNEMFGEFFPLKLSNSYCEEMLSSL